MKGKRIALHGLPICGRDTVLEMENAQRIGIKM